MWYNSHMKHIRQIVGLLREILATLKEILAAVRAQNRLLAERRSPSPGANRGRPKKPSARSRGPKNTAMMKFERRAVETYLEVECHRSVGSCTNQDAAHVWNLPENRATFNAAAARKDERRGYPSPTALRNAVAKCFERKKARKNLI